MQARPEGAPGVGKASRIVWGRDTRYRDDRVAQHAAVQCFMFRNANADTAHHAVSQNVSILYRYIITSYKNGCVDEDCKCLMLERILSSSDVDHMMIFRASKLVSVGPCAICCMRPQMMGGLHGGVNLILYTDPSGRAKKTTSNHACERIL